MIHDMGSASTTGYVAVTRFGPSSPREEAATEEPRGILSGAKAHRRFKHAEREHGYLGCQIDDTETVPGDPDSQVVYVNQVGVLGSPALATHRLASPQ